MDQPFTCPKCGNVFFVSPRPSIEEPKQVQCGKCYHAFSVPRALCLNCQHCSGHGGHISIRGKRAQERDNHIPLAKCHSLTASGSRQAMTMMEGISFVDWTAAEECDEFKLKTLVVKP